ncbi:glutamate carboxypeptidase [Evansella vedderi]|uniref:Glutamate carboxypeptidase n=1 Tax=Evansella vedderi TaxID=38282 RepID=A0ABT9ZU41_9BACI|nr:M20 family metallopeptidase [Evansella vedderi]MDQ0254760.1 glutamate carboxypeptidase [Evansella vedderi]
MQSYIKQSEKDMLFMLEKLVNIDSGSYNREGVNEVGALIRNYFESIGFQGKALPGGEYGDHLLIEHPESINPSIILVAHMDTVFPKGTAHKRPFKVEGDRAYGPGVIDMKGSHVTLLYALKALTNDGHGDCLKNLQILFNSDEEVGSRSSRSVIEQLSKGKKYAIIMEPSRESETIVSARRGGGRYTVHVKGRASHAGVAPEKGRNALEVLARKIIKLHQLSDYENGISVSVGLAEGGTAVNTVPPVATAEVDVRISTYEQADEIEQKLKAVCAESEMDGTEVTLNGHISRPPMMKNEGTEELLSVVKGIGKELGITIEDKTTGGGSDAAFTAAMGVPTVDGIGPIGGNAHSEDEFLYVPSLQERTYLLAKTIKRLSD